MVKCPRCFRGKVHTGMSAPDCHYCGGTAEITEEQLKQIEEMYSAVKKQKEENKLKIITDELASNIWYMHPGKELGYRHKFIEFHSSRIFDILKKFYSV